VIFLQGNFSLLCPSNLSSQNPWQKLETDGEFDQDPHRFPNPFSRPEILQKIAKTPYVD